MNDGELTTRLQASGISYCRVHFGTVNEDDPSQRCDWADREPLELDDEGEPSACDLTDLLFDPGVM